MQFFAKPTIGRLQWTVWIFVFVVLMLSLLPMDGLLQSITYALHYTLFYAAIIYGNILWLYPRLYQKGQTALYICAVITFLLLVGLAKSYITLGIYNAFFAKHPEAMSFKAIASMVIGGFMVFLLSFIFRIAIEYFKLKQQSDEIIAQKTQAELNLLKSQVQPHFLFNTLNNIYYEAYLEAPRTASLIERLSDMMRYFIDESPRQFVSLSTEIQFVENYIALEKIRIRYDIDLVFKIDCDTSLPIPPMLLMTFVENIFKHGIDKSSNDNKITMGLKQENGKLIFTAENTIPLQNLNAPTTGFGLANLRKRLILLYADNFDLHVNNSNAVYKASLTIPLA